MRAQPKTGSRTLSYAEYIAHQERQGIFKTASPCPENDPDILRHYLSLMKDAGAEESAVHLYAGKYGFFVEPMDPDRAGISWALCTPVIDPCIGVSSAEFMADLPALREEADYALLTDTFSCTDGYGVEGTVKIHSPVANIDMAFDSYLESLTSERRKKYRRMADDFSKTNLRFDMSDVGLSAAELDFIRVNLEKKWGEDALYAYSQTLWAASVQKMRPAQNLVMRVMDGDRLVFVQSMIARGNHVYCQCITKDEDSFFSGLAAFTDFKCLEALCPLPAYNIFDPAERISRKRVGKRTLFLQGIFWPRFGRKQHLGSCRRRQRGEHSPDGKKRVSRRSP